MVIGAQDRKISGAGLFTVMAECTMHVFVNGSIAKDIKEKQIRTFFTCSVFFSILSIIAA